MKSISIITPTYNSEKYIEETISSILNQTVLPIEYIVVDGLSNDSTLEIVERYRKNFEQKGIMLRVISEQDTGMYSAINKGIKLSNGEIITYLNSDDFYSHTDVIERVIESFQNKEIFWIHGNIHLVDQQSRHIKSLRTIKFRKKFFGASNFSMVFQPTLFFRREVVIDLLFNERYRLASDYEFIYRLGVRYNSKLLPMYIANLRLHQDTLTSKDANISIAELRLIKASLGIKKSMFAQALSLLIFKIINFDNHLIALVRRPWFCYSLKRVNK
jgi:glycosyltransferase involved in cell wall biosynthesis